MAPDVFVAVAMMKKEKMFFGKGDFKKVLVLLTKQKSEQFKDVSNKI